MSRVALVAPAAAVRPILVGVAGAGTVQLDAPGTDASPGEAARRLQRIGRGTDRTPRVAAVLPDLDVLERTGRSDLLAGEAELEERAAGAVRRGAVTAVAGWVPQADLPDLAARLAGDGGAVVHLPSPPGVDPPTLVRHTGAARSFEPLVGTYATVPYRDVDPTVAAGVAYIVMFGMMFGDAGHGLLLLLAGLALRAGWPRRLARLRQHWQLVAGAGAAATLFGLAYGEFFGPTGVVPALWLDPLDEPTMLLAAAVGLGALLLAGAYGVGIVNRLREGGWSLALYASGGIAGATLFLGAGLVVAGWYAGWGWLAVAGGTVAVTGLALAFTGLYAASGGGGAGAGQAVVELVDTVTRLGGNVVSFTRLAAFGITHAAIAGIVWAGAVALWGKGPIGAAGAVVLFAVGTALAFGLEALVAAIQALRLEYYELFSRVFATEGRPFHPWRLPVVPAEEVPR
ncbi:MAG TPA: V-type ATPase 116kDa subunit family protein [Mycobacteriales bacterium]|jgi:V/A-type H+-transporting ATPase subunit I